MANRGIFKKMYDADDVALEGTSQTADWYSESYELMGMDWFGIVVDLSNVSGGGDTLDISVQITLDNATTWLLTYPGDFNSETDAALDQITAAAEVCEVWRNWLPHGGGARIRFFFDIGSTVTVAITNIWFFAGRGVFDLGA